MLKDNEVRKILDGMNKPIVDAAKAAQKKFQSAHDNGECNCNEVRRDIAKAIHPAILRLNSGVASEFCALLLANQIIDTLRKQQQTRNMLRELREMIAGLGSGEQPDNDGEGWKHND